MMKLIGINFIGSYDFFVNRQSCYAINQQQLQCVLE